MFREQRYFGTPGPLSRVPVQEILLHKPIVDQFVGNIDYTESNPLPPQVTVRWTGDVALKPGKYQFDITTDDGMKIFLNEELVLDAWFIQPKRTYQFKVEIVSATTSFFIDYFNEIGKGIAIINWTRI